VTPHLGDRRLLYAAAFLRALATGMVGVLIALWLSERGFDSAQIGRVVGAGLSGAAAAALLVTLLGDRIGRRRALQWLALGGAAGGVLVTALPGEAAVTAAAFLGMLNGMGRDRGASLIIDQAILPATAPDQERTAVFAWYNVLQDAGHALGGLAAGLPVLLRRLAGTDGETSLAAAMAIYSALLLLTAFIYRGLSSASETPRARAAGRLSPRSRRVLWKISALFSLDSLAGGFLTAALLTLFFHQRFGASVLAVGVLFFAARAANAGSHLLAAWLARRIGLVNTMVFTHIPSSLLLVSVGFAPSYGVAALLFLLREGLVEMDVPTRQSYVAAIVQPHERTFATGVTHLVRLGSWAVAPAFAGALMREGSLALPLYIGAAMKIVYDLLLYGAFRRLKPPEEEAAGGAGGLRDTAEAAASPPARR
jgi:MFS family permease